MFAFNIVVISIFIFQASTADVDPTCVSQFLFQRNKVGWAMIVAEWSFSIPNIFCSIPIHVKVLWKTLNTLSGK